ncbi:hypothetical protein SteCoe_31182 [Stentor coeruleus]|uniref:t-SNARE coiled-coil homology domain-containing protein n=1 Tax=Stentor coeruleus TaxID=5963 RepID=A0A1R2B1V1_9CILI|nr:hypothetical protein SteCoe_31182 [Stentor coeruleus]
MESINKLIDSAYGLIRQCYSHVESSKSLTSVEKAKASKILRKTLEQIEQQVSLIEKSSQNIPIHEKSRVLSVAKDIRENLRKLQQSSKQEKSANIELTSRPSQDYSSYSNTDILRQQKVMKEQQEKHIDSLISTIQNVKSTGKEIGDELDYHIQLLDTTESLVNKTNEQIENNIERMMRLVDRSSNHCLLTIIIILVILIILTLFFL